MRQPSLYPPNPQQVPSDLTEMDWPYFLRALLVLCSLLVFVTVYLGLLIGSGYLCYASLMSMRDPTPMYNQNRQPPQRPRGEKTRPRTTMNPLIAITGGVASGLVCLFLIKGFFKWRNAGRPLEIEITEEEQPELFAFLRQLCKDAGAPLPYRVFLSPEVNACVFYENPLLSLFMPTNKNLLIGLGLVNRLNLTEFKAVLAHEFGHFAQGSMLFGSYVYQANRIIGDMVYGRDFFDDFVERMQYTDIRVAVFFKCFAALIWVLRKCLEGIFYTINFANSSLSRQMEFNADLVAVTITGSDSIEHALAKLETAAQSLDLALKQLTDAGDHKLYSRDLFHHQTQAAEFLKRRDPTWGELPALPHDPCKATTIFEPGDDGIPRMWASHPSNFDRERNAKRRYIRGVIDERSPWILFAEPKSLRERLTQRYYLRVQHIPAESLADPEQVQSFIDAENSETSYSPRFHGMYDDRLIDTTGWEMWKHVGMELRDPQVVGDLHGKLYGPWLQELMAKEKRLTEECETLAKAVNERRPLTFRGETHSASAASALLDKLAKELNDVQVRLAAQDRIVFQVHYAMAEQTSEVSKASEASCQALLDRYGFHAGVQQMFRKLRDTQQSVLGMFDHLGSQRQLEQQEFREIIKFFQDTHQALDKALNEATKLRLPRLINMVEGQPLSEFLLTEPLVSNLADNTTHLDGAWTGRLQHQLAVILDRIRRIHFKSLGGILALYDQIADAWKETQIIKAGSASPPEPLVNAPVLS